MTDHNVIRGEFTVINNQLTINPGTPAVSSNPIAKAHVQMVAELSRVVIPRLHVTPEPEEFEDVADYILRTVRILDRWLKDVGEEVRSNSTVKTNTAVFEGVFLNSVEGFATFECDRSARASWEQNEFDRDVGSGVRDWAD